MKLTEPKHYKFDPGRSIPRDEWPEIEPTITPIEQIVSRSCKRESTNDKWRLGNT